MKIDNLFAISSRLATLFRDFLCCYSFLQNIFSIESPVLRLLHKNIGQNQYQAPPPFVPSAYTSTLLFFDREQIFNYSDTLVQRPGGTQCVGVWERYESKLLFFSVH